MEFLIQDSDCRNRVRSILKREEHKKLVIMLIDAWQKSFFNETSMPFLAKLSSLGNAKIFEANVQPPTVTMPRIKALTAGIVPSFIDVLFNFASVAVTEDNLIDRMKAAGKRLVFCGDDTWLRLFPGRFNSHSVGVVSFYVSDYTEVDDNVTRCAVKQLIPRNIGEWDVMVLHYLGLDHIGHSLGGTHGQIVIKLAEMDRMVKKIYSDLNNFYGDNFLIVVLGDHGMTGLGGHGGSSFSETHVPLAFVDGTPVAEKVDLVPTLSFLNHVAIPQGSLGVSLIGSIMHDGASKNFITLLSLGMNTLHFVNHSNVDAGSSYLGEGRVTKGIKVKKRWSGQPMIGLYLDLTALQRKL
ncbi:unnamed protein product [Enterobius vermicularis]|uniref:GPI ethanolamine phosphate transferase 2 n=1 Tax=Enterobius vermicularis TaxID=51028 RepID=A0A0N4VFL7_ENTVE|nr:unnamed protein product [Enterobius vermicularis]